MSNSTAKRKQTNLYRFLIIVLGLIILNVLAYRWYTQVDLTKDKRYSTTQATSTMLKGLEGEVVVTVFLKNDKLPAAFQNLSNATAEMLKTFGNESGQKVSYRFVDPTNDEDALKTLTENGMTGFPVTVNSEGGSESRIVFPWVLVNYIAKDGTSRSMPVMLQEANTMVLNKQILTRSEVLLEYNLANTIRQLAKPQADIVAYLMGNGQAVPPEIMGIIRHTAQAQFGMDTLNLQAQVAIPNQYKALIIVRPTIPFTDVDLFKIDQFVMRGGKLLVAADATLATIDSFQRSETFTAIPLETNLNQLLFPYGARINSNLVLDATANSGIPVASQGTAQTEKFPWPYHPVLEGNENHPISKNLQGVLAKFPASIDLNENNKTQVNKQALLQTSIYGKTIGLPALVMYKSVLEQPNFASYDKRNVVVAALLTGTFVSPFVQHQSESLTQFINENQLVVKAQSDATGKVIVVADADVFLNEVLEKGPADMGTYRFEQGFKFDNSTFYQNCLNFLVDENHLLEARSKSFQSRILDPKRVNSEQTKWQIIAIGLPVVLVVLLAIVYPFLRKRKYAGK